MDILLDDLKLGSSKRFHESHTMRAFTVAGIGSFAKITGLEISAVDTWVDPTSEIKFSDWVGLVTFIKPT